MTVEDKVKSRENSNIFDLKYGVCVTVLSLGTNPYMVDFSTEINSQKKKINQMISVGDSTSIRD